MRKKVTVLCVIVILLFLSACNNKSKDMQPEAKVFVSIKDVETTSNVTAGILFDDDNAMYVAKNDELLKITSDGIVSTFCSFTDISKKTRFCYTNPLIWDMTFDNDGNILAAAQDRILKIMPDGSFITLLEDDFKGFLGASSIAYDKDGNFYITNGEKIEKVDKDLERTTYIDGSKSGYTSFFSFEFDKKGENVYVSDFNTKSLLKYQIDDKGNVSDTPEVIVRAPLESVKGPASSMYLSGAPLNIVFSKDGTMYVSIDIKGHVMKVDKNGNISYLALKYGDTTVANHIIAFGEKGFNEDSLYITTLEGKEVFEYRVE